MSKVRFIGDLHLGHINMAIKRGFKTVEDHDNHIIQCWNSVVHKRDVTWILGDVTMESSKSYPLLKHLNGMKKIVLGNHDRPSDIPELMKYVQYRCYLSDFSRSLGSISLLIVFDDILGLLSTIVNSSISLPV